MKKLIYCAAALATMFFTACQQENLEPAEQGTAVNFSVELPGEISTKVVADGNNVDELHYAIYKYDVAEPKHENAVQNKDSKPLAIGRVEKSSNRHFNVTFDLLADQNYVVIFWAQVANQGYYELGDLRSISMTPASSTKGNEEDRAAFFRTYEFNTTEVEDHTVMLYRPFAQLNLGTTKASLQPQQEGQKESYIIDAISSEVRVTGLATTFNTIADLASEDFCGKAESVYPEMFTFKMHDVITEGSIQDEQTMTREYLSVKDNSGNKEDYEWIAMNYFFATDECNVTVEYDIVTDKGTVNNVIKNVPVKENFRTNIIGNLLTSKNDFEIVVDEQFVNPATGQLNPDQNVYVVSVADVQGIQQAFVSAPENATLEVVLGNDINLGSGTNTLSTFAVTKAAQDNYALWLPAGKSVILNLNGYKISYSSDVAGGGLLYNEGILEIAGEGEISYSYVGTPDSSYGKGNQTIDNRGVLTVNGNGVKVVNASAAMSHAAYAINTNAGATLNIKNGEVRHENGHAIRMVSFGVAKNTVNIEGGYVLGTRALQIQLPSGASAAAPEMDLNVTGGTLESNEETYNLAIYVFSNGQSAEKFTANLAGGVFKGNVAINAAASDSMLSGAMAVSGGTFNGAYGVYSYADEAGDVIDIKGGAFASLYSMMYLNSEDEVYKLANDIDLDYCVTFNGEGTLDLNGYTIQQTETCSASYSMIENKGKLTICGGGKISFKDAGEGDPAFGWGSYTITNRGSLVVEDATIENLSDQNKPGNIVHMVCAIQQAAGKVVVNGGVVSTPCYRSLRANGGEVVINGGEFVGQVWMQPNQKNVSLTVNGGTFSPVGGDASSIFMTNEGENCTMDSASITGGTFTGKVGVTNPDALAGCISGGRFTEDAYAKTAKVLFAESCTAVQEGNMWVVVPANM